MSAGWSTALLLPLPNCHSRAVPPLLKLVKTTVNGTAPWVGAAAKSATTGGTDTKLTMLVAGPARLRTLTRPLVCAGGALGLWSWPDSEGKGRGRPVNPPPYPDRE